MEGRVKVAAIVAGVLISMYLLGLVFMEDEDDEEVVEVVATALSCDPDKWEVAIDAPPYTLDFRGTYSNGELDLFPLDVCYYVEGKRVIFRYSDEKGYPIVEELVVNGTTFVRETGGGSR